MNVKVVILAILAVAAAVVAIYFLKRESFSEGYKFTCPYKTGECSFPDDPCSKKLAKMCDSYPYLAILENHPVANPCASYGKLASVSVKSAWKMMWLSIPQLVVDSEWRQGGKFLPPTGGIVKNIRNGLNGVSDKVSIFNAAFFPIEGAEMGPLLTSIDKFLRKSSFIHDMPDLLQDPCHYIIMAAKSGYQLVGEYQDIGNMIDGGFPVDPAVVEEKRQRLTDWFSEITEVFGWDGEWHTQDNIWDPKKPWGGFNKIPGTDTTWSDYIMNPSEKMYEHRRVSGQFWGKDPSVPTSWDPETKKLSDRNYRPDPKIGGYSNMARLFLIQLNRLEHLYPGLFQLDDLTLYVSRPEQHPPNVHERPGEFEPGFKAEEQMHFYRKHMRAAMKTLTFFPQILPELYETYKWGWHIWDADTAVSAEWTDAPPNPKSPGHTIAQQLELNLDKIKVYVPHTNWKVLMHGPKGDISQLPRKDLRLAKDLCVLGYYHTDNDIVGKFGEINDMLADYSYYYLSDPEKSPIPLGYYKTKINEKWAATKEWLKHKNIPKIVSDLKSRICYQDKLLSEKAEDIGSMYD